jgi:hypothetical protein
MNEAQLIEQNAALLKLLTEAQSLGLTFHVGSAYISRAYISAQDDLNARIDAAIKNAEAA